MVIITPGYSPRNIFQYKVIMSSSSLNIIVSGLDDMSGWKDIWWHHIMTWIYHHDDLTWLTWGYGLSVLLLELHGVVELSQGDGVVGRHLKEGGRVRAEGWEMIILRSLQDWMVSDEGSEGTLIRKIMGRFVKIVLVLCVSVVQQKVNNEGWKFVQKRSVMLLTK